MFGKLHFHPKQGLWVIDAEPHVHMRAKRVFGKLSKQQAGVLWLSDSFETCRDLEWFLDRYGNYILGSRHKNDRIY